MNSPTTINIPNNPKRAEINKTTALSFLIIDIIDVIPNITKSMIDTKPIGIGTLI